MPELPEVETVKRSLTPVLLGKTITRVEIYLEKAVKPGSALLKQVLPGQTVHNVERRGKYLILTLEQEDRVVFHLRMTGQLLYQPHETPLAKHTTIKLCLDDDYDLRMVDQRKFGTVNLVPAGDQTAAPKGLVTLGPEPLSEAALRSLKEAAGRRKGPVKGVLLDQKVIAGLGNIYTDEALFIAGINPSKPANSVTEGEWDRLYQAVCIVLEEGIKYRGTTRRDYVDGRGQPGGYQDRLRVYGRKGGVCLNCGEKIKYARIAGRGSHFCPKCQL